MLNNVKLRQGAWLALAALWLQLAMSFAHMHPQDVWGPLGFPVGFDPAATQLTSDDRQHDHQSAPDLDLDEDGCGLCAAMALVGSALLGTPAILAPVLSVWAVRLAPQIWSPEETPRRRPFQARAPPANEIAPL